MGVELNVDWVQLTAHPNYDIQSVHPFMIRKRANRRIIALITDTSTGYIRCWMDGRMLPHHRLIAEQFLVRPEGATEIDHINHIRSDNRLHNIRWVSSTENARNKTAYNGRQIEYADSLPEGAEPLTGTHGRPVAPGHYQNGRDYYVEVAGRYRRLTHKRHHRNGWQVEVRGPNGERINISWHD
jgi:hypothetical protein